MKNIINSILSKLKLLLFGNTISFKINLLHLTYNLFAKCYNIINIRVTYCSQKNELKEYGFYKFKPFISESLIKIITKKSDDLFNNPEKVVASLSESGLIRLKNSFTEMPELESIIYSTQIQNYLNKYYKSNFKIFSCDMYRTIPSKLADKEKNFSSLLWHFDNCPSNLIKIMIYLNDVTTENGAIALVPKKKSLELRNKGYWNRWNNESFVNEIESNKIYLEGKTATALLFSTHYCIHKATLPNNGYRDVAVFLIQPSIQKNHILNKQEKQELSMNYGYCINPFNNTPLRFGNE